MSRKLALKRLTASDLTLFRWHFEHRSAGKQKGINLNANVFVDRLYPGIAALGMSRRFPIDLYMYGPGLAGPINLQRKILKGETYKNWRLNGEFIANPIDHPTRFNVLVPGDFVLFEFEGDLHPTAANMLFVTNNLAEDQNLYQEFTQLIPQTHGMIALPPFQFEKIITQTILPVSHPIYELSTADIEDVVLGGSQGVERLLRRPSARRMTRGALQRARENADRVGNIGEQILYRYFKQEQVDGQIVKVHWESEANSIAPYDFEITLPDSTKILVDAKSTEGDFERPVHISLNELRQMAAGQYRYDLYRVFHITENSAMVRIAPDMQTFATSILAVLTTLPKGISADSISVAPTQLSFGPTIQIKTLSAENLSFEDTDDNNEE